MVIDDGGRIDAEAMVNGSEQLTRVYGIRERGRAGFIGLAVDVSATDARTGERRPYSSTASGRGRRRCCRYPRC